MSNVWAKHSLQNPDHIKNNPGISQCDGMLTRIINGKTKRFRCQLRWDHTGECLNYSGRKSWAKGKKLVRWDQMQTQASPDNSLSMNIERAVSEAVSKVLSQEELDMKD